MIIVFVRIGSDEDDEGDDAEYSNEDPSDTAVSHDYCQYTDDMCARETAVATPTAADNSAGNIILIFRYQLKWLFYQQITRVLLDRHVQWFW